MNEQRSSQALFDRFRGLEPRLEACSIGAFPTRVHRLDLPGSGAKELWVKREDLSSPVQGGNKVRKLELLLARGSGPVLTFGPWGSHHVLATALHARCLGRDCFAVLVPQPMDAHHKEIHGLIRQHCAGTLELKGWEAAAWMSGAKELPRLARPLMAASRCTVVPPGGSNGLGTLGYVAAGLELQSQIAAGQCPMPTRLYVPLGTGGTAAGLALGLALAGLPTEVVAVQVAALAAGNTLALHQLADRARCVLLAMGASFAMPRLRLRVCHGFLGPGYARPTNEAVAAQKLAQRGGLLLETTYTAKTLAAMLAERRTSGTDEPWMLLHTYGAPSATQKQ